MILLLITSPVITCLGQKRFPSGELKGFVKSGSEHIIARVEEPFVVCTLTGTVVSETDNRPLENVIFEVRGPENEQTIRATKTDRQGRFEIKHLALGAYLFKATLDGFQSVVGIIMISKMANPAYKVRIKMPIGE